MVIPGTVFKSTVLSIVNSNYKRSICGWLVLRVSQVWPVLNWAKDNRQIWSGSGRREIRRNNDGDGRQVRGGGKQLIEAASLYYLQLTADRPSPPPSPVCPTADTFVREFEDADLLDWVGQDFIYGEHSSSSTNTQTRTPKKIWFTVN